MSEMQLENELKVMSVILSLVGISHLLPGQTRKTSPKLLYMWQMVNVLYAGMTVASMTWYIIRHTAGADDVGALGLSERIGLYFTFWILSVKLLIFFINRNQLQNLTEDLVLREFAQDVELVAFVMKHAQGKKTQELRSLVLESRAELLRILSIFTNVWAVNAYLDLGFFVSLPLVLEYIYPGQHYRELPLGMAFPWDDTQTPFYQLSYFLKIIAGFICIATFVGPDPFFSLLVGHIIRQLQILRFILLHMVDLVTELTQLHASERDNTTATVIASCAQHYSRLKTFCASLNSMYAPFFLVQVLCTSCMLCMSMYTIATDSIGSARSIKNIMYSAGIVVQIGVYCFVVQKLIEESERTAECAVEQWWAHGRRNRSSLQLFHVVLQRPITMHMFGSIELCHATFGAVMRTSYTYFTFLRTMTNE